MRNLAAVLFLLAGSVSADPVDDVARLMARELRTAALMQLATDASREMVQQLAESDDPVVQSQLMSRVMNLFDAHFHSPDFERNVLVPWLRQTFSNAELEEIAAFGRTEAGRKLIGAWPGVGPELVRMSIGHLQTDIAEQALGSRRKAEEMMEQARIRRTEADLRSVATAIAAFQMDQNAWPPATDMRSLRPLLSPTYIKPMPERDAWGRPFSYRVEGTSYRLASAGPDGVAGNEDDVVVTDLDGADAGPSRGMPQAPSGAMRVGGDVKAPTLIRRVEPVMTDEAVRAKIGGIVILECVIDAQGQVTEARVLKPLPFGLDQAAVDAVRQWQFRPGTLHGQPVPVVFNLTVNFVPKRE